MARGNRQGEAPLHPSRRKEEEYLYAKGPATSEQIRIERMAKRIGKHAALCKSYVLPDALIVKELLAAQTLLKSAAHRLGKIPKTWRPVKGTLGSVPIEEGSKVIVKDAVASKYYRVFNVNNELTVTEIIGSRILCEVDRDGQTIVIPMSRSHVQLSGK
jgi:hypothetical protein